MNTQNLPSGGDDADLEHDLEILRFALEAGDLTPPSASPRAAHSHDQVLRALIRVVLALHARDANVSKAITELARLPDLLAKQLDVSMRSHDVLTKRIVALEAKR